MNIPNEIKNIPTISTSINGQTLVMTFANGDTLEINAATLSKDIQNQAMMHGLKQKCIDAAAISRNTETGKSATVADKFAAVHDVVTRLKDGQWNKVREAGAGNEGGLLIRALCELYPRQTRESLMEFLSKKTPAEKNALRAHPEVAKLIDSYRPKNSELGEQLLSELE